MWKATGFSRRGSEANSSTEKPGRARSDLRALSASGVAFDASFLLDSSWAWLNVPMAATETATARKIRANGMGRSTFGGRTRAGGGDGFIVSRRGRGL